MPKPKRAEKKTSSRNWCFTNYKLDFDYAPLIESGIAVYICYGNEICPTTQRPHHQGFVIFPEARSSVDMVSKDFGNANCRACNGNLSQNADYCKKDDKWVEFGERPVGQGKRTDLNALAARIHAGESVATIARENYEMYHQYGRTLNYVEDLAARDRERDFMTEGIWITGPTGSGKSRMALHGTTRETRYILPRDGGWWDGYCGQETVVINEFRATTMPFEQLLQLADMWPEYVRRRGREPMPFMSKKLIITTVLTPEQCWPEKVHDADNLNQFYRRFKVITLTGVFNTEVV
jgi:hypothetical protein